MGKKEKVVDLKPKVDKISKEHLDELLDAVNKINSLQFNIGRLETQKHKLLHDISLGNYTVSLLQYKMMKEYGS